MSVAIPWFDNARHQRLDPVMHYPITATLLVAGWTAMWLTWMFKGEVRHWIVASMPDSWRVDVPPLTILAMSADELELFIAAESDMPYFLRGILTCRLCMSAWISGVGTLCALPMLGSAWSAPLIWGCGAYIANCINPGTTESKNE